MQDPAATTWTILHSYPAADVDDAWREFLTRADFPAHYVSPEYFREPFVRDKKPFVVLAWQGERVVGAVSGTHEEQQLVCGLMSRPQICFDRDVDPEAPAEALISGLLEEAGPAKLITLHSWVPLNILSNHGYQCKEEEGVVMLDLTKGADALFKQFAATRRTDIRNAIKRGVEVFIANTREEFRAYYEIYVDWCQRKNIPASPFETLEEALNLQDSRRLFLARYEGKIIAGTIIRMYPGEMIEYAANTSWAESLKLRPNDLLQWRVVEWACGEGYKRYSLGGAHLFSRRMGGNIVPVYRYRYDRTWLRRYELKEALGKSGRKMFNALPDGLQSPLRRALKTQE
jgi:hypothetical protein